MQSIFRYPGGKTRKHIREWIKSHCPPGIKEYREPFVGGGGIYFHMHHPEHRWINDRHEGLVAVYTALRDRPTEFIEACRSVSPPVPGEELTDPGPRGKARYPKRMVEEFNRVKLNAECDQAYRYYYVNRTVFGGRVNYDIPSRLYFSNPDGWNITTTDALENAAEHIEGTKITCGDFEDLLLAPGEDVWIYCDPPYAVNTDFTPTSQLYQHGFSREDHHRFAKAVLESPHRVCVSYDDDPDGFIRSLFNDPKFRIIEASWRYCGSTNETKEIGKELLILNYEPSVIAIAPEKMQLQHGLDDDERQRFAECESAIDQGVKAFRVMGEALRTIRDSGKPSQRLYRETHQTFEDYCQDRWGFNKDRASQLISASNVVGKLETITNCNRFPESEGQARELNRIGDDTEKLAEVWQAVTEDATESGKKITASFIRPYVDAALDYVRPEPDYLKKAKSIVAKMDETEFKQFREWLLTHP